MGLCILNNSKLVCQKFVKMYQKPLMQYVHKLICLVAV